MTRARAKKNPALPAVRFRRQCPPITIPTDLERLRFQALAYSLHHAKARSRVEEMLKAGYSVITEEDKVALAAGIHRLGQDKTDLMRKPTKHNRGRKPAKKFSDEYYFNLAKEEVRKLGRQLKMSQRDVLDVVALVWGMRGWYWEDKEPLGPYSYRDEKTGEWHKSQADLKTSLFEKFRDRVVNELHLNPPTTRVK
jgi:hypothetical protein